MTATRNAGRWVAALVLMAFALVSLAACGGGGSDDEPLIKPTTAATASPSASPDPDGFTPEQRALADQVTAYFTGVTGRGSAPVDPIIGDIVTPSLLATVSAGEKKNVDDKGLQYLGDVAITVDKVTITGDTATVEGCNNGSGVFLVKKGQTDVSGPSQLLGYSTMDIKLVRQDGRWLIDSPRLETVKTC